MNTINPGVPVSAIKGPYQLNMRPRGTAPLTDAQVNAIAAYLYSVSHK